MMREVSSGARITFAMQPLVHSAFVQPASTWIWGFCEPTLSSSDPQSQGPANRRREWHANLSISRLASHSAKSTRRNTQHRLHWHTSHWGCNLHLSEWRPHRGVMNESDRRDGQVEGPQLGRQGCSHDSETETTRGAGHVRALYSQPSVRKGSLYTYYD